MNTKRGQRDKTKGWKHVLQLLTGLLLAVVLATGCSSSGNDSAVSDADVGSGNWKGDQTSASSESAPQEADSADYAAVPASGAEGSGEAEGQAEGTDAPEQVSSFTGADVTDGLNKKLIYSANLVMEVDDYAKAQTEVRNLITLAKGYIVGFTEQQSKYEQGGTFTFKVPAAGFSPFLSELEKVKHVVLQRSIEGQDFTEEYVDLESRLKAREKLESQYIAFMDKATTASDLVEFANQLGQIQEQIEQIKGRMRYIDQNVSYSTVELRLYQTDESLAKLQEDEERPLLGRASSAFQDSIALLSGLFQWLFVFLVGASPVLVILTLALVIWLKVRRARGKRERSDWLPGPHARPGEAVKAPYSALNPEQEKPEHPQERGNEGDAESPGNSGSSGDSESPGEPKV